MAATNANLNAASKSGSNGSSGNSFGDTLFGDNELMPIATPGGLSWKLYAVAGLLFLVILYAVTKK